MSATSDRELARHWREWADDTGKHVVNAAYMHAQGIGGDAPDMRTLLWFAFMAGWHARRHADVRAVFEVADADTANLRRAVREAIELLQEAAK